MNQDLAKFFEFTPDACCVLDARGVVKHANPAFKRVMADTSTDLIGRRLVDLVHVDDAAATRERLAETSPDTSPTTFASRLPSTTDRDRVLLWSVRAEPSTGLLYASARDITDLERERDSLRQIIDASPGAMVLVDEHGSISMVNRALERIFGYERDELLGQAIEVLVPRADRDTHRSHRQAFTAQPRARPMGERRDLVGVHKD
ncbi:MAG: PAS domain S-box protein, partial [Gemmatimonadota bacterium]|nr:PAS domain S-box protein [Gemmatimonadota bacterium]